MSTIIKGIVELVVFGSTILLLWVLLHLLTVE
jgi:hypothetical protein